MTYASLADESVRVGNARFNCAITIDLIRGTHLGVFFEQIVNVR